VHAADRPPDGVVVAVARDHAGQAFGGCKRRPIGCGGEVAVRERLGDERRLFLELIEGFDEAALFGLRSRTRMVCDERCQPLASERAEQPRAVERWQPVRASMGA